MIGESRSFNKNVRNSSLSFMIQTAVFCALEQFAAEEMRSAWLACGKRGMNRHGQDIS